jgi:hypothetical protein
MAGDNTVDIVFQAEDNASATFSKVNNELAGVQAKAAESNAAWRKEAGLSSDMTVNWTKLTRESAQAQEFMSGKVGKTAADFGPATAAMREASVATKGVGEASQSSGGFMESFAGRLVGVTAAFEVLRYAAEAVKYVVTESMDLESAEVRFKSLAGNTDAATTAFEGLGKASDDTNMSVADLAKTSDTLLEAGVKMEDIPATITRMGQAAKVSNIDLQESANALLRASRGEVGARDITTATRLAGDETGRLQAQYKDISVTIPNIAKEMERTQQATARTRQDADRLATRTTQDANLVAARSITDLDKLITRATSDLDKLTGAQSSFGEAHGGEATFNKFRGLSGGTEGPSARANAELTKELREGTAQIGKEEGVDAMALVRSGEIKMNEVIQAYGRSHAEEETKAARGREDANLGASRGREDVDTKAARGREDAGTAISRENADLKANLELRREREKMQLATDVTNELQGITDSPVWAAVNLQRNYQAHKDTVKGQAETAAHVAQREASHVGSAARSAADIDANSAGTVVLPWSSSGAAAPRARDSVDDWLARPQASAGKASNADLIPHLAEVAKNTRDLHDLMSKVFA